MEKNYKTVRINSRRHNYEDSRKQIIVMNAGKNEVISCIRKSPVQLLWLTICNKNISSMSKSTVM